MSGAPSPTRNPAFQPVRLQHVMREVRRPVLVKPGQTYKEIGVRSHGRGVFHKELITGDDLGTKRVFWLKPGSLVFNIVFAWERAVAVLSDREEGMIGSHRFPTYEMLPGRAHAGFLKYYFTTGYGHYLLRLNSPGAAGRNKTLNQSSLMKEEVWLPAADTQKAIAAFLDRKTAAIDALIEKKQKLVDLLAEKRAALINHLLAPLDAPHVRLARTVELLPGYAFSSSDFLWGDEGVPLLRGINVGTGALRWDDVVRLPPDVMSGVGRFLLQPGDIVLGMDRPWIGGGLRVATITQEDCPCLLLQRVARLRPKSVLRPAYLRLALEWKRFRAHLEPELTGVSVPHLSGDQILSYRIPVPSLDVQDTILSRVRATQAGDESIHDALLSQIDRLQEYRQALITAAVTGQLDIPEEAA